MLNAIKHKFDIIKAVAIVTYKEWAVYRTHSMVSIFVGPVYFITQYFIWTAVYSGQSDVGGMTLDGIIAYFGITALIGYFTMDFADWNLQMLIRTGKYETFALRPINHIFFAFSQKAGHRVLGVIFEVIPVSMIFIFIFKVPLMPVYPVWAVISVILCFFMNFFVNYTIGLTAFWLTQSSGLRQVFQLFKSIFSGALIPLTFFPEVFQKIFFYLPFQYVSYVPATVWTGNYPMADVTIPQIVAIQAVYTVLAMGICFVLYNFGNKRFSGVGG